MPPCTSNAKLDQALIQAARVLCKDAGSIHVASPVNFSQVLKLRASLCRFVGNPIANAVAPASVNTLSKLRFEASVCNNSGSFTANATKDLRSAPQVVPSLLSPDQTSRGFAPDLQQPQGYQRRGTRTPPNTNQLPPSRRRPSNPREKPCSAFAKMPTDH